MFMSTVWETDCGLFLAFDTILPILVAKSRVVT